VKCQELLATRADKQIETSIETAQTKFMERHKDNIEATEKVFRTAYECAKSHLPFREHTRLIELQSINGLACGEVLKSYHSCANIVSHIASCMRDEISNYIVQHKCPFSILVDESTSVANVQSLIVYVRLLFDGDVCTYFLGLIPLPAATAAVIHETLINFLSDIGLRDDVLRQQLIVFVVMVLVV